MWGVARARYWWDIVKGVCKYLALFAAQLEVWLRHAEVCRGTRKELSSEGDKAI